MPPPDKSVTKDEYGGRETPPETDEFGGRATPPPADEHFYGEAEGPSGGYLKQAGETLSDAAVGAARGLTLDTDDEIWGALNHVGHTLGVPGAKPYTEARNEARARHRLGEERSPGATLSGQVLGGAALGAATGGLGAAAEAGELGTAAKGAATAAKAVPGAAKLAVGGAAQGLGNSEATDAGGLATDAAKGAGASLAVGGAAKGVGALVGRGARLLPGAAARSRAASTGMTAAEVAKAGGAQRVEKDLREQGVFKPSAGVIPPNKEDIAERAAAAVQARSGERRAIEDTMRRQGVGVSGKTIAAALRRRADEMLGASGAQAKAAREGLLAEADRLERGLAENAPAAPAPAGRAGPGGTMLPPSNGSVRNTPIPGQKTLRTREATFVHPEHGESTGIVPEVAPPPETGAKPLGRLSTPASPRAMRRRQVVSATAPTVPTEALAKTVPVGRSMGEELAEHGRGMVRDLRARAAAIPQPQMPVNAPQRAVLEEQAQALEGRQLPFDEANHLRAEWGHRANFGADTPQAAVRQDIHGAVNNAMTEAANAAEPGAGDAWRRAGALSRTAITARDAAEKGLQGEAGRPIPGTVARAIDAVTGGRAASIRAQVQELGASAANRLANPRTAIGRLLLPRTPGALGRVGAAQAIDPQEHYEQALTDPEYNLNTIPRN